MTQKPSIVQTLLRGVRRKCPRCGEGSILKTRFTAREVCEVCHLRFARDPGDLWAFWVFGDRLFLGLLILCVFVLFRPSTWDTGIALFAIAIVPMILTIPHRMGIAIGLDYFAGSRFDASATGEPESNRHISRDEVAS